MESKYHIGIRILHWLVLAIMPPLVGIGFYMSDLEHSPLRNVLFNLHKSLGVTILSLFIIRLIFRITTKHPAFPNEISKLEQIAAKLAHYAIYALVFIIAISGALASNYHGKAVNWFGIKLPMLINEENLELARTFGEIHENTAPILIILVVVHALAALKHLFKDNINLFKRII